MGLKITGGVEKSIHLNLELNNRLWQHFVLEH